MDACFGLDEEDMSILEAIMECRRRALGAQASGSGAL